MRAFRIAYDGRPFHGFQRQPDVPTVEDALLDALEALDVLDPEADAGAGIRPTPPGYAAAGRTDAGVSALAQTVAFEAPAWLTPRAFSAELPESVHAWAHADVPEGSPETTADFNATHDAARRLYVYHLHASGADPDIAATALSRIAGEHDFDALTTDDSGTVRTLETGFTWEEPYLDLRIESDGFPRHLVRRIASLVEQVAIGERSPDFVDRVLDDPAVPESEYPSTAPAEPLVLQSVTYPEASFVVDDSAAANARDALAHRRVEASTRARTMSSVEAGIAVVDAGAVDAGAVGDGRVGDGRVGDRGVDDGGGIDDA